MLVDDKKVLDLKGFKLIVKGGQIIDIESDIVKQNNLNKVRVSKRASDSLHITLTYKEKMALYYLKDNRKLDFSTIIEMILNKRYEKGLCSLEVDEYKNRDKGERILHLHTSIDSATKENLRNFIKNYKLEYEKRFNMEINPKMSVIIGVELIKEFLELPEIKALLEQSEGEC